MIFLLIHDKRTISILHNVTFALYVRSQFAIWEYSLPDYLGHHAC